MSASACHGTHSRAEREASRSWPGLSGPAGSCAGQRCRGQPQRSALGALGGAQGGAGAPSPLPGTHQGAPASAPCGCRRRRSRCAWSCAPSWRQWTQPWRPWRSSWRGLLPWPSGMLRRGGESERRRGPEGLKRGPGSELARPCRSGGEPARAPSARCRGALGAQPRPGAGPGLRAAPRPAGLAAAAQQRPLGRQAASTPLQRPSCRAAPAQALGSSGGRAPAHLSLSSLPTSSRCLARARVSAAAAAACCLLPAEAALRAHTRARSA